MADEVINAPAETPSVDEEGEEEPINFPLQWEVPDTINTRYATNFVVQRTQHEFFILFFEVRPPILFGPPKEGPNNLPIVRAECIARIVVTPDRLAGFIEILQKQLENYQTDQTDKDD